jgi:hypothetical protein
MSYNSEEMNFDGFSVVDFPPANGPGFVYVLCWVAMGEEIPFYVGQTQSIWGRLNDYYWADFQASTDFRVGEAVRYLTTQNLRVVARYKLSADRRKEERAIIDGLDAEGRRLLNNCPSFDYRTATEAVEKIKVRQFIDGLIAPQRLPENVKLVHPVR